MEKKRRVLLKLSGEALAGEKKTGFDEATVKEVARQVKLSVDQGVEVGIGEDAQVMQLIVQRQIKLVCWLRL